jgi:DNA repair protein SbcC/Rad50
MIPIRLRMKGFLSYRQPAEVDFSGFELACISGPNGAGKSSLLDAMTWALFGQARKRDEALINAASPAAEVVFVFLYEGSLYRIQRALGRGKTTVLEFQIGLNGDPALTEWKPLTEKTVRDTQARIRQVLRLDYDTFVNASFFLQGKADQFTQQPPADRKRILASILGLDAWETYRERTAERRRHLEADLLNIDGRLAEIESELAEEPARQARLAELQTQLDVLAAARKMQADALEGIRRVAASLAEQRKLVDSLAVRSDRAQAQADEVAARLGAREAERESFADSIAHAREVEAGYTAWQQARAALEKWDALAAEFREHEKRRQPFLDEINVERAKLEQELTALRGHQTEAREKEFQLAKLKKEIAALEDQLAGTKARLKERDEKRDRVTASREEFAALRAENDTLRGQMDEVKDRIARMEGIDSPTCPLCGQSLSPEHRESTIAQLNAEGKSMGDRYRDNRLRMDALGAEAKPLEGDLVELSKADDARVAQAGLLSELKARHDGATEIVAAWKKTGDKRLLQVDKSLAKETYAAEARASLKELDRELKALGYDVGAHDQARHVELAGRQSEAALRGLEAARAALAPLEREIGDLKSQLSTQQQEAATLRSEYEAAAVRLAADQAVAPDLKSAELSLLEAQERENILRQELGAARQKVTILGDLRARKAELTAARETLGESIGQHKTLERAFGKDGVPALLIEQALPEIETHANEVLDRLSNGAMSVRFQTQAEYKDQKRKDLKETLDIVISDSSGTRDYEMFSGGEAFRVNFAIRLALSRVLAQRTGARLQMLVIDEGFGSQDALGRQRLIEAINLASVDFAKILVITHMDELKEAFPNRIEVEKTPAGSVVTVY